MAERLAILDRDGTINVDYGFVHRWEDWQFLPGAIQAMCQLRRAGFQLLVVSNQSGIGRGYYTAEDVERLHQLASAELLRHGVDILAFLYCPHSPDQPCRCRKPLPGLVLDYVDSHQLDVDLGSSWTIGDKPSDVGLGERLGTNTVLLYSSYWEEHRVQVRPTFKAASLWEATQRIVAQSKLTSQIC